MNGFVKVAAASPVLEVGNCQFNIARMEELIRTAAAQGVQMIVFPELSVTGYTCQDLFEQELLIDNAEKSLLQLVGATAALNIVCLAGLPLADSGKLFNCAVLFGNGRIIGVVPKLYLPNYKEFQEMRWFVSGHLTDIGTIEIGGERYPFGKDLLFRAAGNRNLIVGVEICEDVWTAVPPSSLQALKGACIILNPSASNEIAGKNQYLKSLVAQQSARCIAGYVYACAGFGESSTDLLFAGKGFIAENGAVIGESERFTMDSKMIVNDIDISYLQHDRYMNRSFAHTDTFGRTFRYIDFRMPDYSGTFERTVDAYPFVPKEDAALKERCDEILHIQIYSLAKRLKHVSCDTAVIGISGGLDSTLALMVTARAFDKLSLPRTRILGITMPGFGTTDRTYGNAVKLMRSLDVTLMEIPITDACMQHFKNIGHDGKTLDVTYENTQARERTQILMDLANMHKGIVIGTGDLSELALGWTTYNGDHISMYAVNAGVPKTLVKYLVEWIAGNESGAVREVLLDIASTPISPELTPADAQGRILQKTEDIIGPYELHDFYIYHFIRFGASPQKILFMAKQAFGKKYDVATIEKWLRVFLKRFFSQQFKRNCLPDGPKVGSISLSPRCDWRMPSDAAVAEWLE